MKARPEKEGLRLVSRPWAKQRPQCASCPLREDGPIENLASRCRRLITMSGEHAGHVERTFFGFIARVVAVFDSMSGTSAKFVGVKAVPGLDGACPALNHDMMIACEPCTCAGCLSRLGTVLPRKLLKVYCRRL